MSVWSSVVKQIRCGPLDSLALAHICQILHPMFWLHKWCQNYVRKSKEYLANSYSIAVVDRQEWLWKPTCTTCTINCCTKCFNLLVIFKGWFFGAVLFWKARCDWRATCTSICTYTSISICLLIIGMCYFKAVVGSAGGGVMASLYGSKVTEGGMTLELSLEINKKLQVSFADLYLYSTNVSLWWLTI